MRRRPRRSSSQGRSRHRIDASFVRAMIGSSSGRTAPERPARAPVHGCQAVAANRFESLAPEQRAGSRSAAQRPPHKSSIPVPWCAPDERPRVRVLRSSKAAQERPSQRTRVTHLSLRSLRRSYLVLLLIDHTAASSQTKLNGRNSSVATPGRPRAWRMPKTGKTAKQFRKKIGKASRWPLTTALTVGRKARKLRSTNPQTGDGGLLPIGPPKNCWVQSHRR